MARSSTIVQVDLESHGSHRTCWVEPKVRVGDVITLKDSDEPSRLWIVRRVGEPVPRSSVRQDWHNDI